MIKRFWVCAYLSVALLVSATGASASFQSIDARTVSQDLTNEYTPIFEQDFSTPNQHKLIVSVSNDELSKSNRIAVNLYRLDTLTGAWVYQDVFVFSNMSDAHVFSVEDAGNIQLRARAMDKKTAFSMISVHTIEQV